MFFILFLFPYLPIFATKLSPLLFTGTVRPVLASPWILWPTQGIWLVYLCFIKRFQLFALFLFLLYLYSLFLSTTQRKARVFQVQRRRRVMGLSLGEVCKG